MKTSNFWPSTPSLLTGIAGILLLGSQAFAQEDFNALKTKLSNGIEQQPEKDVVRLLELGLSEHMPAQASAVAESWLKHNLPQSPKLLYLLGRNAEMSGNWREAVAAYQQFLGKGDIKSEEASDAITAVHSILIKQLDDADAAYSFSRREAGRLSVSPRFRQYDRWFLNQARERTDIQGVVERLTAIANSGASADHLRVFHQDDLLWVVNTLQGIRLDQRPSKANKELVDAAREMAKANSLNEELRLLVLFKAASRHYNLERIDGKELAAPIEEAKQLLAKYPHLAAEVQTDWAGGNNGPHYRDDPKKYWPHQLEGKLPPIQEAVTKLDDLRKFQLLKTWSSGYYGGKPLIITPEEARQLALNSPQLVNHRLGPELSFGFNWEQLKLEEAKALSPKLEHNPSPDAATIRTIALAGEGKNLDAMIDHLIKHECWRLDERQFNHLIPEQLWSWAGKPGGHGKRGEVIKRFTDLKPSILDPKVIEAMPADKRLQEFRKFWQDFRSPAPKLPGVEAMVYRLAKTTPQAMEEILKDDSLEARDLASRLLNEQLTDGNQPLIDYRNCSISTQSYSPYVWLLAARVGGMDALKNDNRYKAQYKPHPLLPAVTDALNRQIKSKQVDAWLVMAWINLQFPEQLEQATALAQEVMKTPGWDKMPARVQDAMQQRFPAAVFNPGQLQLANSTRSEVVCKALFDLNAQSSAAQATEAIKSVRNTILTAPHRITVNGMQQLGLLSDEVWADAGFTAALADFIESVRPIKSPDDPAFGNRLQAVASKEDAVFALKTAPFLWIHVERHMRTFPNIKELTERMSTKQPEAASALARIGLQVIGRHKAGHTWFKKEEDVPMLNSVRGKTALLMGLVQIPVPANHPNYPVHLAQAEWMTENRDSAWKLIDSNWDIFMTIHREMSLPFLMWVLERSIQTRENDRQEVLIRSLLSWTTEAGSSLRPAEKGAIEIAYGDIAVQRGQLREAGEIFSKIQKNEIYKDLPVRFEAALRRVRVDRLAKNYDGALQLLTELEMERVASLWNEIRFARAEIYFDQEEYSDCADDINSILNREPNHPDAKILLGKVQLRQQKLMEATTLDIGSTSGQKSLVPGERLKVMLADPTLAVSGAGTEIEVVVWANSGDREQFFLRQFGDQKTKYVGEVNTSLGKPSPDDGTLQVIGDDEVFYAYSERFRAKMNDLEEMRGGPIRIASDAVLMASARKLLSESEQRRADMQSVMEEISATDRRKPTNVEGAAKAKLATEAIKASMEEPGVDTSLRNAERNIFQIAKPGNPIHVRVVDPDRSRTPEVDELQVSIASSSGDIISSVTLKETETHSGWFEGSVPTTGATARAMAQSSEPGRNPNMVISAKADYPAWRPIADSKNPVHEFVIDLNDRVDLGELTLKAAEEGSALKRFIVQTGSNRSEWTTVGIYPSQQVLPKNPWMPSVTVVSDAGKFHHYGGREIKDMEEIRNVMQHGWMDKPELAIGVNVSGPSQAFPASILKDVNWVKSGRWDNPAVLYHFKAHFHDEQSGRREFRLDLGNYNPTKTGIKGEGNQLQQKPQFLLFVNGRQISEVGDRILTGATNIRPGIQTIELWGTGWAGTVGFGRTPVLQMRGTEEEPWVTMEESLFDPRTFPIGSFDPRNSPAEIKAIDGGKAFNIKFAPDSNSRLVRFLFVGQEGPVPAINKISLTDNKAKSILPLEQDYAELNKNQILEILTGDRIYVRYRDDRFVTPSKERIERFLNVSFTDANLDFADMEPRWNEGKQEHDPYYEKLIRFQHGQPLDLAIHDADMDSTVKADTVKVTLGNGSNEVTMTATETGDSTGTFRIRIIPVTGAPSKDGEFQVPVGGTIIAKYIDQENNRPGIATERITSIQHAAFVEPTFVIGDSEVSPWQPEPGTSRIVSLADGFEPYTQPGTESESRKNESVQPRWQIEHKLTPSTDFTQSECRAVLGHYLYVEVHAPQYALGVTSSVKVYAQTESGRKAAASKDGQFDTSIPGTIELNAGLKPVDLRYWRSETPTLATYVNQSPWSYNPSEKMAYDRFFLAVPIIPGMLPEYGVLTKEEREDMARLNSDSRSADDISMTHSSLIAKPGELIHIGFKYTDPQGQTRWLTAKAKTTTHPVFDIMSEDYQQNLKAAYAGEHLNLRVVDLGADVSDELDTTAVLMQAKSGAKYNVVLHETGPHTGIFKQSVKLSYTQDPKSLPAELDVAAEGFPITYGDTVAARYTDRNGLNTDVLQVSVSKGADGMIAPFSKQYQDEEVAMRTQFSLAEAYLEMAKRHRTLGQNEQAELEYTSAKMLLAKAMDQFTDADTRAHAEYLLGTLTMEEAESATDPEIKETRYRAALSRFMSVTGTYSESIHASRAQYRIATIYDTLGESDIAAQEYVKLAYKYPDSEYLATSMGKLGSHFLKKAAEYEAQAKPLLAKAEEDKDAAFEGEVLQKLAVKEYIKTASIFGRLQERFPDNKLAGRAGIQAGQAYMRAKEWRKAIDMFKRVINEESYDGPKERAAGLFWSAMCYQEIRQEMAAYSAYKRLTFDFPESEWAGYARAKLSEEKMLKLESDLEIERLESGR